MTVLGSTTDFPTWGSSKGTENPPGIWLWRPVGFDYRISTGLGKQTLGGHKQNLVHTKTQEKGAATPQETDPDLPECPGISGRGMGWQCLLQGRGDEYNCYHHYHYHSLASGQTTGRKHNPTLQEKIGWKIYWAWPWEKAMAPHSSTLAWKITWTEEPGRLQSMGSLGVRHDWATSLWLFTFMHWRRKWQPTPEFLPGESQERGSLVGCCLWGRTE